MSSSGSGLGSCSLYSSSLSSTSVGNSVALSLRAEMALWRLFWVLGLRGVSDAERGAVGFWLGTRLGIGGGGISDRIGGGGLSERSGGGGMSDRVGVGRV